MDTSYQIDMKTRILDLQEEYWMKMNKIADIQLKKEEKIYEDNR